MESQPIPASEQEVIYMNRCNEFLQGVNALVTTVQLPMFTLLGLLDMIHADMINHIRSLNSLPPEKMN